MALRKVSGIHNVKLKEVRELLKLPWVRDEELSDRWHDVRLLPDGRVLYYAGEHISSTIFPSREVYAEWKREGEEMVAKGPIDLTLTLLPPITDFIRDVEAHAASVGKVLRVPDEALDFTEASLDAVDAALMRVRPAAKRMTPEIVTPVMAYVGEVMRRGCGGRWTPGPTTRKRRVDIYEPAELAAWQELARTERQAAQEKARGASPRAAVKVLSDPQRSLKLRMAHPSPIGFKEIEEPVRQTNCPMIVARDGQLLDPFRLVVVPMVEPSKRVQLRAGVDVMLLPYRPARPASGSPT